jgi:peptide chain release factor subunit 1
MQTDELRKIVEVLRGMEGDGTTLVSYLVMPKRSIADARARLAREVVEAENIKLHSTRHAVVASLTKALTAARGMSETPENGVALYASPTDTWLIEPPEPIQANVYRCGSEFVLEPLEAMLASKEVFALIVIDRQEATLGWLRGSAIEEVAYFESRVMGKHDAGGQSQHRFERQIEHQAHEFFVKVAEAATQAFVDKKLTAVAVGGPGATKEFFVKEGYLDYRLQEKVLPAFNVGYTNEAGLRELALKVEAHLPALVSAKERVLLQGFFAAIRDGRAAYGKEQIARAIAEGRVESLILSHGVPVPAGYSGEVQRVGEAGDEAAAFKKGFGGIGALLRY